MKNRYRAFDHTENWAAIESMADSLTGIVNSSIQPWLEFSHRFEVTKQIQLNNFDMSPCQLLKSSRDLPPGIDIVYDGDESVVYSPPTNSCQRVCRMSSHLQDPYRPTNLLNCGLWASLASLWMESSTKPYYNASNYTTVELPDHVMAVLQNFTKTGLYYQDLRYLIDVRDQVSWALTSLLSSSQESDSWVSPQRALCSEQGLFFFEQGSLEPGFQGVLACVKAICKIRRLDPDLGGIGVRSGPVLYSFSSPVARFLHLRSYSL